MHIDVKRAVLTLMEWWVFAKLVLLSVSGRIPFMDGGVYQVVHGMLMGLVVGLILRKFSGIKVGQVIGIALGWAVGQLAASYAFYYLVIGLKAIGETLPLNIVNLLSQAFRNSSVNTFVSGLTLGGILGLILSLMLRQASILDWPKIPIVSLGWAIGWGLANMGGNFIIFSIFHNHSLITYMVSFAIGGGIVSLIGGLVMFTCIQDS